MTVNEFIAKLKEFNADGDEEIFVYLPEDWLSSYADTDGLSFEEVECGKFAFVIHLKH